MNIDDFRFMRRGKVIQTLSHQEASVLGPIDIRRPGNDRALLLLHGFSSSPAVFRELLPQLPPYNAIICPTLPGHGESIAAFKAVKACDWLTASEEACLRLMNDYQRVDVMGISLGGLLACHLSQRFALNHLYLLAPALVLQLNIPLALKLAQALNWLSFNTLRNRAGNLCSQTHSELAYRQLPIPTIIEILTLINEFPFKEPQMPTDLFLGSFDEVVDSEQVAKRFFNAPQCNIHWLQNSAHVLPLDNDVNAIIDCMNHQ